jgi:hypothetical protein
MMVVVGEAVASGGVAVAGDVGDTPLAVACVMVSPRHNGY